MCKEIVVTLPNKQNTSYPILMGPDLYDVATWLPETNFSKIVIITDNVVKKLYGVKLQKTLKRAGHDCLLFYFSAGEKNKNQKTKQTIENAMLARHCGRDTLVLALGGGVVGDLAGFIAATYLRGVPYIQIPTTLLAMIDSSVGGKTAINSSYGKNLIGAIYQPLRVVADFSLLKSLSHENRINGLVEAIKIFLTHDAASFQFAHANLELMLNSDQQCLQEIVSRAVAIKAGVVARDEHEQGERGLLNFGHTIGHALEKVSNYKILHGYAVGYGILVEATMSYQMGLLKLADLSIITDLFSQLGFQGEKLKKYAIPGLLQACKNDKKNRSGKIHSSLLHEIGRAHIDRDKFTHQVEENSIKKAFQYAIAGNQL